jgi:hypothetical protein
MLVNIARLHAVVLAAWTLTGAARNREIEDAIVTACAEAAAHTPDYELAAATMAVYSAHESSNMLEPPPSAWDARAGVSCGPWQMRCSGRARTVLGQARQWLWMVRRSSLANVDSSATRAASRLALATRALE